VNQRLKFAEHIEAGHTDEKPGGRRAGGCRRATSPPASPRASRLRRRTR
jgi:hypothetical protein